MQSSDSISRECHLVDELREVPVMYRTDPSKTLFHRTKLTSAIKVSRSMSFI